MIKTTALAAVTLLLTALVAACGESATTGVRSGPEELPAGVDREDLATAVFVAGCFWWVEEAFDPVPGVVKTTSSFIGRRLTNPTYEFVELVVTKKQLTLHARDDRARVIDLSDAQANALVWSDNGSRSVPFAARSATALTAAADLPTTGKFRIVVSLELPGQEKTSLLFGPMRL
ncbi:MAG: hypothetical protein CMN28_00890 [Salinisphaeraceae bacterium]|jgi:hypothetical protein|nr:hypothetical protein [Salinisphaeraceae bacterium]